jgi:hypothetical protein
MKVGIFLWYQFRNVQVFYVRHELFCGTETFNSLYLSQFNVINDLYKKFMKAIEVIVKARAFYLCQVLPMSPGIMRLPANIHL